MRICKKCRQEFHRRGYLLKEIGVCDQCDASGVELYVDEGGPYDKRYKDPVQAVLVEMAKLPGRLNGALVRKDAMQALANLGLTIGEFIAGNSAPARVAWDLRMVLLYVGTPVQAVEKGARNGAQLDDRHA